VVKFESPMFLLYITNSLCFPELQMWFVEITERFFSSNPAFQMMRETFPNPAPHEVRFRWISQ